MPAFGFRQACASLAYLASQPQRTFWPCQLSVLDCHKSCGIAGGHGHECYAPCSPAVIILAGRTLAPGATQQSCMHASACPPSSMHPFATDQPRAYLHPSALPQEGPFAGRGAGPRPYMVQWVLWLGLPAHHCTASRVCTGTATHEPATTPAAAPAQPPWWQALGMLKSVAGLSGTSSACCRC